MPENEPRGWSRDEFLSSGYYIARILETRSPHLPPRYFSPSSCISDLFPGGWAWNYAGPIDENGNFVDGISDFENRLQRARAFGIEKEDLTEFIRWAQWAFGREYGVERTFYSLQAARRATEWVQVPQGELVVFGVGLHRSLREQFMSSPASDSGRGAHECLSKAEPLAEGGRVLGFELLNVEMGQLGHSWICNGLEQKFMATTGLRLNSSGRISDYSKALEFAAVLNRKEIGAEPPPWFPWLIVEY